MKIDFDKFQRAVNKFDDILWPIVGVFTCLFVIFCFLAGMYMIATTILANI